MPAGWIQAVENLSSFVDILLPADQLLVPIIFQNPKHFFDVALPRRLCIRAIRTGNFPLSSAQQDPGSTDFTRRSADSMSNGGVIDFDWLKEFSGNNMARSALDKKRCCGDGALIAHIARMNAFYGHADILSGRDRIEFLKQGIDRGAYLHAGKNGDGRLFIGIIDPQGCGYGILLIALQARGKALGGIGIRARPGSAAFFRHTPVP